MNQIIRVLAFVACMLVPSISMARPYIYDSQVLPVNQVSQLFVYDAPEGSLVDLYVGTGQNLNCSLNDLGCANIDDFQHIGTTRYQQGIARFNVRTPAQAPLGTVYYLQALVTNTNGRRVKTEPVALTVSTALAQMWCTPVPVDLTVVYGQTGVELLKMDCVTDRDVTVDMLFGSDGRSFPDIFTNYRMTVDSASGTQNPYVSTRYPGNPLGLIIDLEQYTPTRVTLLADVSNPLGLTSYQIEPEVIVDIYGHQSYQPPFDHLINVLPSGHMNCARTDALNGNIVLQPGSLDTMVLTVSCGPVHEGQMLESLGLMIDGFTGNIDRITYDLFVNGQLMRNDSQYGPLPLTPFHNVDTFVDQGDTAVIVVYIDTDETQNTQYGNGQPGTMNSFGIGWIEYYGTTSNRSQEIGDYVNPYPYFSSTDFCYGHCPWIP